MMDYRDIHAARNKAQSDIALADRAIRDAANLIVGRLRSSGVQCDALYELKKELADYNLKTWEWKKK